MGAETIYTVAVRNIERTNQMMDSADIKKGMLVKTGTTLGVVLQGELKFKHHNLYAWVYYFNGRHHKENPCWVFLGSLNNIERATK